MNKGSRDNLKDVCLEFAERDTRFKYIKQENGGLLEARNTDILNAKREFITFIDGDDFVDPNYLEELYHIALKNNSEVVIGSYKRFNEETNKYYIHEFDYREEIYINKELIENIAVIERDVIEFQTSWSTLFHRRLFENVKFSAGKNIEDTRTNYKLYMESCKSTYINKDLYVYRIRKGSLSDDMNEKLLVDILEALLERIAVLSLVGIDISEEKKKLIDRLQTRCLQDKEAGIEDTEIYRRCTEILYLIAR